MSTNVQDPFLGYDYDTLVKRCFIAMLSNPEWYGRANNSTGSKGILQNTLNQLATWAGTAATTIEAQIKSTTSV